MGVPWVSWLAVTVFLGMLLSGAVAQTQTLAPRGGKIPVILVPDGVEVLERV
jgi:hypothetical protein